jgi:type III pantothenate kinase
VHIIFYGNFVPPLSKKHKMNLIIDSGNTLAKAALFQGDEIIASARSANDDWSFVFEMMGENNPEFVIISDVSNATQPLKNELEKSIRVISMTGDTPVPLKIAYTTPETLGPDRIAAAVYGQKLFPDHHVLVIQAGTCITYEFLTPIKEYLGGAISPGMDMRLKAMHTFTAKLPLVKKKEIDYLTGNSTENSILSGVINGCIAEIDGMIDKYRQNYQDLKVIAGGGDIFFFDKKLKNRIFATENLVLRGLNEILNFNIVNFEK